MTTVCSLFNQQMGLARWRTYNHLMSRLICAPNEDLEQIVLQDPDQTLFNQYSSPVFACKFSQLKSYPHILALANEEGQLGIYNTNTSKIECSALVHRNAIFDLAWVPKSRQIITAAGDHSARLTQVTEASLETIFKFYQHYRSLKVVACRDDDPFVFATGGRDSSIILWDTRIQTSDSLCDRVLINTHQHNMIYKQFRKNSCAQSSSASGSVTGLVFQNDSTLISCGAGDGQIKIWDMRKSYSNVTHSAIPKFTIPYSGNTLRNGFSNLVLDQNRTNLYVNCLDNVIYCYNVRYGSIKPVMTYFGHKNSTFYVKSCLSPDGNYLLSGSSDSNAYIWNVRKSEPLVRMVGHEAEVTCVAWRNDRANVLVTCSDDMKYKIWRAGPDLDHETKRRDYRGFTQRVNKVELDSCMKRPFQPAAISSESLKKGLGLKRLCSYLEENCIEPETQRSSQPSASKKRKTCMYEEAALQDSTNDPATHSEDQSFSRFQEVLTKRLRESDDDDENILIKDLPNFVVDGQAPHLNNSPVKRPNVDWLTSLRRKRKPSEDGPRDVFQPVTPKRKKFSRSLPGSPSTSQSPLMKFFKVTNNSNGQQCRSKSPLNGVQNLITKSIVE